MKRRTNKKSFASLLMVLFLLFSIVCVSLNAAGSATRQSHSIAIKKPGTASTSDTQLPEKVESENDHKPHINFLFIHAVGEIFRFDTVKTPGTYCGKAICFRTNVTRIPLYLAMRSIVI